MRVSRDFKNQLLSSDFSRRNERLLPRVSLSGLALWLRQEHVSTTWTDAMGNYGAGTNTNCTIVTTARGNALSSPNTNTNANYLSIPYNASYEPTTAATFAIWVNMRSATAFYQTILSHYVSSGLAQYHIYRDHINNVVQASCRISGVQKFPTSTTSWSSLVGLWTFLVLTYDGSDFRMYINAKLDSTLNAPGSFTASTRNIYLMGGPAADNSLASLDGSINDLWIYTRALSDGEIYRMYNATRL